MKYRCLTSQELEPLRDEFVQFLAANGMAGDDWRKLQGTQEAQSWIEGFSQVVWEKSLPNIRYVEMRQAQSWMCIAVRKDEMEMIRLSSSEPDAIRFDADNLMALLESKSASVLASGAIEIMTGTKKLEDNRSEEIYGFLEQGFTPCQPIVFASLQKILA